MDIIQNKYTIKIKIQKQCCQYCGKEYTRKTSYSRHVILCELLNQTKREKKCIEEETTDIPTIKQLYNIIQELGLKCQNMEIKMNEMQKWVDNKKKKLNVIQWLNLNSQPLINIKEWIQSIQINEEHITILFEQPLIQIILAIIETKIQESEKESIPIPIYCLTQKPNLFYCYEDNWVHFTSEYFSILLNNIHIKLVRTLTNWYDSNLDKINNNDKMQILYNKTMIKLMSVNFTQDVQILSKIKSELFQSLKTDFKYIEFEFEY